MNAADSRKSLYVLGFAMVVVSLGFGMIVPIFPFFIDRLGAGGGALGLLVAVAALTEFLFGPLWGSLSDRVGRRPVLMIGMLGYGLAMLLTGLATTLWMLFAARALSGVLSSATMTTALATIGDSTTGRNRGGGMGLLGAAAGVGTVIGPGLGGLLAGDSLTRPFFFGAGVSLVALGLIAALLPETLPAERRTAPAGGARLFNLAALRAALGPASPIRILLLLALLATFGTSNFESVFGLYLLKKLNYGTQQVGAILTVVGLVALVGRGLLTGPVTRRWGEASVIRASLLAGAAGFVFLLLARSQPMVMLSTGVYVLTTTFLRPAIHALTSQRAQGGQGSALGLSSACVSMGRVAGPLYAGAMFDLQLNLPYLSGALILLLVFLFSRGRLGAEAA